MLRISETATRAKLIDLLLTAAGWNLKDRTQEAAWKLFL
jgi:type I site-specific restriction endonuclease